MNNTTIGVSGLVIAGAILAAMYSGSTPKTEAITTPSPVQKVVAPTVDTTGLLDSCLSRADQAYTASWQNNCQVNYNTCVQNGVSTSQCANWYGGMCSLGNTAAGQLSINLQRDRTDCLREY